MIVYLAGHRHNKVRDIFAQVLSDVGAQVITEPAQFLDQGLKPDIEAHVVPGYDSPITFDHATSNVFEKGSQKRLEPLTCQ